ncbi:DedA family protein [bacterium]|jgi:membrane protein DedA with SNARE-associated domain|nr:DedA family protein [bacterium]
MDYLIDFLLNFSGPTPYMIVFGILLGCGFGLPIPEDITLIAGGLMSYYGVSNVGTMIVVSFVGVMLGDSLIFLLGAKYGRKLTKMWFFHKVLPDDRLEAVRKRLHSKGDKLLFAARFMPGLRTPIFFSAGTLHVPFKKFFIYDGLAALISVPTIIGAVYHFGDELDHVVRIIKRVEHGILFVICAVILAIAAKWYWTHRKLKRG